MTYTDIVCAAPPPDAVSPAGYQAMSNMKAVMQEELLGSSRLRALARAWHTWDPLPADFFIAHATDSMEVRCRQADWCGKVQ